MPTAQAPRPSPINGLLTTDARTRITRIPPPHARSCPRSATTRPGWCRINHCHQSVHFPQHDLLRHHLYLHICAPLMRASHHQVPRVAARVARRRRPRVGRQRRFSAGRRRRRQSVGSRRRCLCALLANQMAERRLQPLHRRHHHHLHQASLGKPSVGGRSLRVLCLAVRWTSLQLSKMDCRGQFGITMAPVAPTFRLAAVVDS